MARILNGMSIDVEEAFHASAFEGEIDPSSWSGFEPRVGPNVERLLALLDRHRVKATFFVLGWVAERHPDLVRQVHRAGHEIASHGYHHRLIYHQCRQRFREDAGGSKKLLEDITGEAVAGYRAPTYSITRQTLWALDILAELGFQYDSSIFPVRHDRYGIPGAPRFPYRFRTAGGRSLVELPPTTISLAGFNLPVAGGGYFRLYPFAATVAATWYVNRIEQQPAFVYVHPWEIDTTQPRLTRDRLRWWRHSVNQHKTFDRLARLLALRRFGPLRDIVASLPDEPAAVLDAPALERGSMPGRRGAWSRTAAPRYETGSDT